MLNHVNDSGIDTVVTSASYREVTAVSPPRRIQLGMRFEF
jgi:hypothetical protein